jgi:DNA sulfur modification protein DndC
MTMKQATLFDGMRLTLEQAIEQSLDSLRYYGERYRHWALAYSGGKDSSAAVTFVAWAIRTGQIPAPESLTVLYADTRMELPPLQRTALDLLATLREQGFQARVVLPPVDERFLVYMLGYGVPPASNRFRWCTQQIKVEPMLTALETLRAQYGKLLMLTGVRVGESAARDQRIAVSCSVNGGECGQGWFQTSTPESTADTLAPLLHWRVCHVYDWLYYDPLDHGYAVPGVADVYGEEEVRTGCVGCPLASRDVALERVIRRSEWAQLTPLLELKPLWRELKQARWRKRKIDPERRQDGAWGRNVQRMGPLTMEGREYGLARVLDIQRRAGVDFVDGVEEARIREMWVLDMWPRKWSSKDTNADVPLREALRVTLDGQLVSQSSLLAGGY